MSAILPFFDEPDNKNRQPIVKEAKWWSTAHCPDDATNLKYPQGATQARCTHCGQMLSLVPVKWSGQR